MAKKKSQVEIAYDKQLKRIKQFVRRAEKRGYMFGENIIPQKPKKITSKSVGRLAKLTPERLYKKAVYGGAETLGEIVSAKEGLKLEKKARIEKAQETRKKKKLKTPIDYTGGSNSTGYRVLDDTTFFDRTVISNWYATLNTFANGEAYNLLRAWLGSLISQNGEHNVAQMLQQANENGHMLTYREVYSASNVMQYIGYMMDYLPDQGVLYKEQILDKMEYMMAMGDAIEETEEWEYPY